MNLQHPKREGVADEYLKFWDDIPDEVIDGIIENPKSFAKLPTLEQRAMSALMLHCKTEQNKMILEKQCIIGVVELYDVEGSKDDGFAWKVRNPRIFKKPLKNIKGMLGLRHLNAPLLEELKKCQLMPIARYFSDYLLNDLPMEDEK